MCTNKLQSVTMEHISIIITSIDNKSHRSLVIDSGDTVVVTHGDTCSERDLLRGSRVRASTLLD